MFVFIFFLLIYWRGLLVFKIKYQLGPVQQGENNTRKQINHLNDSQSLRWLFYSVVVLEMDRLGIDRISNRPCYGLRHRGLWIFISRPQLWWYQLTCLCITWPSLLWLDVNRYLINISYTFKISFLCTFKGTSFSCLPAISHLSRCTNYPDYLS